jgi:hypothetical protein
MLIGLTGYAQSGKDTVAEVLVRRFGFVRIAFADPIRDFCYEVNPIVGYVAGEPTYLKNVVDRDGWEAAKKSDNVRSTLQNVGVSARNHFGDDFWIREALKKVKDEARIVVTDVRFVNEADWIKQFEDSHIWRIKRPNVTAVNGHVSESQMDGYRVDQIFLNGGSIEDLEQLIITRMRGYDL